MWTIALNARKSWLLIPEQGLYDSSLIMLWHNQTLTTAPSLELNRNNNKPDQDDKRELNDIIVLLQQLSVNKGPVGDI